jgi:hypothetical protein
VRRQVPGRQRHDAGRRRRAEVLNGCRFAGLGQRYKDGIAHLESCRDMLLKAMSSPLYAMNLLVRNKTILAYFISRLLASVDHEIIPSCMHMHV